MKTFRRSSLVMISLAATAACTQDAANTGGSNEDLGPGTIVTVNGERIPESLFRIYVLNALQRNPDELTPAEREQATEDLVRFKLLEAEAIERGLPGERTVAAELELQRLNLLARSMALRYIEENPATDSELQSVYDENLERLAPTEFKARHILVESSDEANAVIAQLEGGSNFAELAEQRADGPTGPNGGDLGWFSAASMPPPIVQALSAMAPGTYSSAPVQSEFGYHVLLLEDTRRSEPPALDTIRQELRSVVDRQRLDAFVRSLRDAATVDRTE